MGTDIHPAVEIRRKGVWRYHRPTETCKWYFEVYDEEGAARVNARYEELDKERAAEGEKPYHWTVKAGDRQHKWDRCKVKLPDYFRDRNYTKFAVLGDVRNGFGFAGVKTFEPLQAISVGRGRPSDISKEAEAKLSNEHSDGWVTLQELLDYDFTRPLLESGIIDERTYLETLMFRKDPESWSGGISGPDIIILKPEKWLELFPKHGMFGKIEGEKRDPTKTYYIDYQWEIPLASAVPDLIEMIEYLKPLVPKGGTPDDVRVVFDFDS